MIFVRPLLLFSLLMGTALAKPNVVIFLSDDQGWGDLSHSGNGDLSTPRIDSLAKDGASFERFYVCPVCSPTRAEFLTGRHHARSGVYSTSAGGERINLEETTIADHFQRAGYRTGAFGKWHNGQQFPYHPNARGFDEFYGFCSGHWGNYFAPMLERNGEIVKGEGFCVDDFTTQAIRFISKSAKKEKPFLVYLPYNTPHSPMQVPDPYWEKFREKKLNYANQLLPEPSARESHKRCALAMCENLDWNVGRVLDHLKKLDLEKETIVVWFHDNGPNGIRWNGGMKGRKGSPDEGGVRSPLFIRWPGDIETGLKVPQICSARDLLPTLCQFAKIEVSQKPLDGRSLVPLLLGDKIDWPERILINQWGKKISARSQQYRLDHKGDLFDMLVDPGQQAPITENHPAVFEELKSAVTSHREKFLSNYFDDDRPFVIAHPESPLTQLPARDAKAHGKIKRSNRFPNCSYFTNWVSTDDSIAFEVEVAQSGKYEVSLYYAAKSSGAQCELRFGEARLPFEIKEVHDVPVGGAALDRFPRMESYVKDFKPINIGTIDLEKGKGSLSLHVLEIPGSEAFEFRLLTLLPQK